VKNIGLDHFPTMAQKSLLSFFKPSPPSDKKRCLRDAQETAEPKKIKYPSSTASSNDNNTNNDVKIQGEQLAPQKILTGHDFPGNELSSNLENNTTNCNDVNNTQTDDSILPKLVITHIPLKGGELSIITNFLSAKKSKELLDWFLSLDWTSTPQSEFVIYNKVVKRPRLTKVSCFNKTVLWSWSFW